ncbi:MAG: hypothetical protein A3J83_00250 [Elusimicrobia bacterium RIFOXYA2_FULL_40_6]|nr:MAG: hypothetical protein A3J83_00250 [Elusimicrobia bacterium RIFOXYA2_FULL_40_6]
MPKKYFISRRQKAINLAFFILMLIPIGVYPQNSAQAEFQLIIPAPDPVNAGEKISFQIIVVNKSALTWEKGECAFEVEIYDNQKNYLAKSDKVKIKEQVAPGGSVLDFVIFNVPAGYSGSYYFRTSFTKDNQRLAYSDFQQFNVTALSVAAQTEAVKPPSNVQVGGNLTIAYKNDSREDWKNYVGNVSLNLLGSIYQKSVVMNLYTYHTPETPFDLYNFILDYRTNNFDFTLGDIMPNFNSLALSNAGMRGLMPVVRAGPTTTSVAAARSIDPVEGTDITNATFARYTYAVNEKIDILFDNSVGISYVTSYDDKTSIRNPGPSAANLYAAKNSVVGTNITIGSLKVVTIKADFASSAYSTSTIDDLTNPSDVADTAYKGSLESRVGILSLKGSYQHVGTDFNSLASPTVGKDKNSYDFYTGVGSPGIGNVMLSYNSSIDNLKNDPAKIITKQNVYSANTSLMFTGWPILSVGYAMNGITGEPVAGDSAAITSTSTAKSLDNNTNVVSCSLSYSMPWWVNSVSVQQSNFKDSVITNNDKQTVSGSYNTTFILLDRISLNLGVTDTKVTDLNSADLSINALNSLSLTLNYKVIKEKLMLALWGNTSNRKDNDLTLPAETITQTGNMEITYYFTKHFSWTVGGGTSNYSDKLAVANNTSQTNVSTRIGIGF